MQYLQYKYFNIMFLGFLILPNHLQYYLNNVYPQRLILYSVSGPKIVCTPTIKVCSQFIL